MSLNGHFWTLRGFVRRRRFEKQEPSTAPWTTTMIDPDLGELELTGRLGRSGQDLVVIVHGMGGCAESGYVQMAISAARELGLSTLALNVRGADRRGEDIAHAALTADLVAALASPSLRDFERIYLLGYSLGGHLALRYATERPDERVCAVAAVCPPLDLSACCDHIDRPAAVFYRRYLLGRLFEIYDLVAARRSVPVPPEEARRIRSQREFDDRIIAARHGFDGVDDYYAQASVGPRLDRLAVPVLMVLGEQDPMIPAASLIPFVDPAPPEVEVLWATGGHLGFRASLDLGMSGPRGLEAQVLRWLQGVGQTAC